MVEPASNLPVKTDNKTAAAPAASAWSAMDDLRREIDRVFEDFRQGAWLRPFGAGLKKLEPIYRGGLALAAPAVDVVENDTAFELTAELPGISAKDIDVSMKDGQIVIKGEKESEKEDKSRTYYLHERHYGSFVRSFAVPDGVDTSAIEAVFNNGVLTVTLPKTMEAQKPAKKIQVKSAH